MSSLTDLLEQQSVVLMEATIPGHTTIAEWRRHRARRTGRPRRLEWRTWRQARKLPMIWLSAPWDALASAATSPWLNDEFVASYVRWREAALSANNAYERWAGVDGQDQAAAFAAYRAALDGEELAARAYRECADRVAG